MSHTVTVRFITGDTICEETFTADRIVIQLFDSGGGQVQIYDGNLITDQISYRQVERAHRHITRNETESSP